MTGNVEIDIKFDLKEDQKYHKIRKGKEKIKLPVYNKNDDMTGTATVSLKDTKKFEHLGIKCYLVGYLGMLYFMQKSSQIKICVLNSHLYRRSWNLLEFWLIARHSSLDSLILKKSMKPSKELLGESGISSELLLVENSMSSKSLILQSYFLMKRSKGLLRSFQWRWRSELKTVFTLTFSITNHSIIWRTSLLEESTSIWLR